MCDIASPLAVRCAVPVMVAAVMAAMPVTSVGAEAVTALVARRGRGVKIALGILATRGTEDAISKTCAEPAE